MFKKGMILYIIALSFAAQANETDRQKKIDTFMARVNSLMGPDITFEQVNGFMEKLKFASQMDHPLIGFALLTNYPHSDLKGPEDFMQNPPTALQGDSLENIITAIQNQETLDLFMNYQGFMVGDGVIWFNLPGGITAYNPSLTS